MFGTLRVCISPLFWCVCLLVCSYVISPELYASGSVQPNVRVAHTSYLGPQGRVRLQRMLRNRGFSICLGLPTGCRRDTIQVNIASSGRLEIRKGKTQRIFQVPRKYKEAQLKARAVVTFVALFVEMTRPRSPMPQFRPPPMPAPKSAPKRRSIAKPKRKSRSPAVRKRAVKPRSSQDVQPRSTKRKPPTRAAKSPARRQSSARRQPKRKAPPKTVPARRKTPQKKAAPAPRSAVSPPKRRPAKRTPVATKPPPARPRSVFVAKGILQPKVTARRVVRAKRPQPTQKPIQSRRRKPSARRVSTRPKKRKLATTLRGATQPLPLERRGWLALDLGALVGIQESPAAGLPVGGSLSFGGGASFWAVRLAINAQPMVGLPQGAALLGRGDVFLGLAPLRGRVQLWFELGPSFELLNARVQEKDAWQYRFGGLVGMRLQWQLHRSFALYARPAFLFFPQAFQFQYRGETTFRASLWRVELALGLSIKLW